MTLAGNICITVWVTLRLAKDTYEQYSQNYFWGNIVPAILSALICRADPGRLPERYGTVANFRQYFRNILIKLLNN
jgi:hypothetical protein